MKLSSVFMCNQSFHTRHVYASQKTGGRRPTLTTLFKNCTDRMGGEKHIRALYNNIDARKLFWCSKACNILLI